jgi:DNA polymerase I-like protein with 3'-5' exonuclease and polymerase domains
MAPRIICLTTSDGDIYHRDQAKAPFLAALQNPIVGQNIAYDMACAASTWPDLLPVIFDAYEQKRVSDTQIAAQLYRISRGELKKYGRYGLKDLAKRWLGEELEKGEVRTTFDLWDSTPLASWPSEYVGYAIKDAVITKRVWDEIPKVPDIPEQCQYAFALHLMGIWGITTDAATVAEFKNETKMEYDRIYESISHLFKEKFVKGKPSKRMDVIRDLVNKVYDNDPPLTQTGQISTNREALQESGHADLIDLAEFQKISTYVNTYIPLLEQGIIHVRYGLAETGRTTARPNIQNQPRKGRVRECYIPRPGHLFCSVDFAQIEMCSLAQVLLWFFDESRMADALNEGMDIHLQVAARLLGIDYSEALDRKEEAEVKDARQLSKIANFGYPGGMVPSTFVVYAKQFGHVITARESTQLRESWLGSWPEMRQYFALISSSIKYNEYLTQYVSGRLRGDLSYTQACNSLFQGLTADGAKKSVYEVQKECYLPGSPLFGTRPVAFIHDEILAEVPEETAHEAATRLSEVMVNTMSQYIPDIVIKAEPALMTRWYKGAEPAYKNGRLQKWR